MSDDEFGRQFKYILYASAAFLGLGLGCSLKCVKMKPSDFSTNSVLFGMKALGIGTLICFGTFGLGIMAVSKALNIKNMDEFSKFVKNYSGTSSSSLKITSNVPNHDAINELSKDST
ncbi:hypothetical protein PCK1_002318 [Pneumocystis canis]|nr:hypothetical protein PCK1_002318 [Pneumocystis canis]